MRRSGSAAGVLYVCPGNGRLHFGLRRLHRMHYIEEMVLYEQS